jgi:hypothetical protein
MLKLVGGRPTVMRAIFVSEMNLPGVFHSREAWTVSYETATALRAFLFLRG